MGDRTTCHLSVPTCYKYVICRLISRKVGEKETDIKTDRTTFTYYDVNYGMIDELNALIAEGIPYDFSWEEGTNYPSGVEYIRFTENGEFVRLVLESGDEKIDTSELIPLLNNHSDLVNYIENHIASITPLPWDNQIEYGKRYKLSKLIGASCAS